MNQTDFEKCGECSFHSKNGSCRAFKGQTVARYSTESCILSDEIKELLNKRKCQCGPSSQCHIE